MAAADRRRWLCVAVRACGVVFDEVGLRSEPRNVPRGALPTGVMSIQQHDSNGSLCYSSSPRDGGVRFRWIDLSDGKWVLVNLGALSSVQLAQTLGFCNGRVGMAYDWRAIMGFVLPFGEHSTNKRFCSDAAVEVMQWPVIAAMLPRLVGEAPLVRWRTCPSRLFEADGANGVKLGRLQPVVHGGA